jgi:tRNA modification GTPase
VSDETIAAIATAAGRGGVGIVRISGPDAVRILGEVTRRKTLTDRKVAFCRAYDQAGGIIDEVLSFVMRAPRSFTGEDVAEIHGHGGAINLQQLLRAVTSRGARVAAPGEFTRRAFENGKLDLARAEALIGVIEAGSERAWRLAQSQLRGRLSEEIGALRSRVIGILAEVEGRIDFPEDDLRVQDRAWLLAELGETHLRCCALAASYATGRAISRGIEVALVGRTNVGKSSLLNALVGRERALVADQPGTTRDYLEVCCLWEGITLTLIDTAGLRPDPGAVESRGIELGLGRAADADVVVVMNDGPRDDQLLERFGPRGISVRSKADLMAAATSTGGGSPSPTETFGARSEISTSVVTGAGIVALKQAILAVAGVAEEGGDAGAILISQRQRSLMDAAAGTLAAARESLAVMPPEVTALEIRAAVSALSQVTGQEVGESVIDEVFARFCIGK